MTKNWRSGCVSPWCECGWMCAEVDVEDACGYVQDFPTDHTSALVCGNNKGSGSPPGHTAGWNSAYPLGQMQWNQGQSSFQTVPAAGNGAALHSEGNFHSSGKEISLFAWTTEESRHCGGESAPSFPLKDFRLY